LVELKSETKTGVKSTKVKMGKVKTVESKTAKVASGDLTMAEQEVHIDEPTAAPKEAKKTLKVEKPKATATKTMHLKPINLINKSSLSSK